MESLTGWKLLTDDDRDMVMRELRVLPAGESLEDEATEDTLGRGDFLAVLGEFFFATDSAARRRAATEARGDFLVLLLAFLGEFTPRLAVCLVSVLTSTKLPRRRSLSLNDCTEKN